MLLEVRGITFNSVGESEKFTAVKIPRQCPFVLLVTVGLKLVDAFGN